MNTLANLQPHALWHYFDEITQVPRPSKKEQQIIAYLQQFAASNNLSCKTDKTGNVLISKPATTGMEHLPSVVLQSHVDMVCEKNASESHDFEKDAIHTCIEGDWVKAVGTTLGADNGIGVAAQLALLASRDIAHGNIECLFTVDEETGLTGATALEKGFFESSTLLNLDTEEEGELCIGCAGGKNTIAAFNYKMVGLPENQYCFSVKINGLRGGHSGMDIDKRRANANKLLAAYWEQLALQSNVCLIDIDGGNLSNAIAREANAVFAVPMSKKELVRVTLNCFIAEMEEKLAGDEPELKIALETEKTPEKAIDKKVSDALLKALLLCPDGVIKMSEAIPGLVETSTNLASIKTINDKIVVTTSQRSSVNEEKQKIAEEIALIFVQAGADVRFTDGYPGWTPNPNSPVLNKAVEIYEQLFNKKPTVKAVHAGLECGLFLEKYPHLDMLSFGPTIENPHSPFEQVNIPSVAKFWEFLKRVLSNKC